MRSASSTSTCWPTISPPSACRASTGWERPGNGGVVMTWVALKMLTGDRAKYLGIIFGVAFASLLMAHQVSIFVGIMRRTANQILDVHDAQIWVMDPKVQYLEEIEPLRETDVY